MSSPAAAPAHQRQPHSIGFNLAMIGVAVALLGVGLAYAIDGMEQSSAGPSGEVTRTLGSTELTIPASWMLEDAKAATGFAKEVKFAVTLPLGVDASPREIDVTLLPRSRVRSSSSLLDGVYLHQFGSEQLAGPTGLIGKPLLARDGYAGETVWYDALSASPFVAKCLAALTPDAPARCLRTVYLGPGLAAVYSFDADVLGSWKAFDAEMYPLLTQIGAL